MVVMLHKPGSQFVNPVFFMPVINVLSICSVLISLRHYMLGILVEILLSARLDFEVKFRLRKVKKRATLVWQGLRQCQ
ncbi:hypothetical protein F157LOC_01578 [Pectobacterium brasiliense]|nr:hypothetical protein F157LOC_01578 [Pectobacterium brasiliense]